MTSHISLEHLLRRQVAKERLNTQVPWNLDCIALYSDFIEDVVTACPNKNWMWREISYNRSLTIEFVKAHLDKPWDWKALSINPAMTWHIIQAHPEFPWDWSWISKNPAITWGIVVAHPDMPWNWKNLSHKEGLTIDIVQRFKEKPWVWHCFTWKKTIRVAWHEDIDPFDIVLAFPNEPLNWISLTKHPDLTLEFVRNNLDKPWNMYELGQRSFIDWEFVKQHPQLQWNWQGLSQNPNILQPTLAERIDFYRRVLAVRRIWRTWFRAITNPHYALCRRRLQAEFTGLEKASVSK